jgi:phosphatidate cytidylyltransferase
MKQRLITGILLAIFFLTVLTLSQIAFSCLILFMAILGFKEFLQIYGFKLNTVTSWVGFLITFMITLPWESLTYLIPFNPFLIVWFMLFVWMTMMVISKNNFTFDQIATLFLGTIYIGIGFHYMMLFRLLEHQGLYWTLLIFICIWSTDTFAYFIGSKFGKHKLIPDISPKKSIEGAIGGIMGSILIAIVVTLFIPGFLSIISAFFIGILIAIFAQLGDLIESAIKRSRGVKDSGSILPGHGGILDRVDSWLTVFPMIYIIGLMFNFF